MRPIPNAFTNDGLFSSGYLENHVPESTERADVTVDERRETAERVAAIWERERANAPSYDVAELEAALVRPILRALDVPFVRVDRNERVDRPRRRPSYAIGQGVTSTDRSDPFGHAIAVADVRRWGRPLDSLAVDVRDDGGYERPFEHPSHRMRVFLEETSTRWGVLTDGRRWRLYGADGRFDNYCEVDLGAVLESDDRTAFDRFVRLFGGEAFREDETGACRLEDASNESEAVSREYVRELREDVCRAVVDRAGERFAHNDRVESDSLTDTNEAGLTDANEAELDDADGSDPDDIHGLDLEAGYERAVRDVFRDLLGRYLEQSSPADADAGWSTAIPFASVTADDGRSSDSAATPLETDVRLDRLEIRHLGRVYEPMLEYELAVAETARPVADGEFAPAHGNAERPDRVRPGDVTLSVDSSERKASGSYYTPEWVVDEVVEHTLDPLVEEIRDGLERDDPAFADAFVDELLGRAILDPAAGTGRFLTGAGEFLVREIVHNRERHAARHGLGAIDPDRDVAWARRRVAARCLYGVDLDPVAIGLARASLWERSGRSAAVRDELEDHLIAGDALVGTDRERLDRLASRLVDAPVGSDGAGADASLERSGSLERLEAIANVSTAHRFGAGLEDDTEDVPAEALDDLRSATNGEAYERLAGSAWFEAAQRRAAAGRYLHWPLEFPDVLLEAGESERSDPGFDAVVGNPPWVATAGRADISATIESGLRSYLSRTLQATEGQFDLYVAFLERAIRLARNGRVGFVVPDSILTREQNEPIRRFLLERAPPSRIVRVGTVFEGVESGAAILVCGLDASTVSCGDVTDDNGLSGDGAAGTGSEALDDLVTEGIPLETFETESAARFLIYLDEPTRTILDRIDERPSLSTVAEIARGEEVSKRAPHLEGEPTPTTRPIAPGSAIDRYGLDEAELRYVEPDDLEKRADQYRSPKLVFRQTSDSLVGTYDPNGLATIKSAYTIHLRSDSPLAEFDRVDAYKHVLGLLNSPLLNYYLRYRHTAYRSVFPQINQSTFESFPLAVGDGPDSELVAAVDARLEATAERNSISLDLDDYLGEYDDDTTLDDVSAYQPAPNAEETMLTETATKRPGLRIDSVETKRNGSARRDGDVVTISVRLRYKPTESAAETDRWGYARTDLVPAVRFVGVDDALARALETFVPHAVEEGDGFAGFRAAATRTITPLDRVNALTLPRLDDVSADLSRYVDRRDRARELDEQITAIDRRIHERVCSLYGVPADERERVRRECGLVSDRPADGYRDN
ncbi:TaqI-like C-terminal specificity domain-containing protein [Natrarchaeobius sp. A-rgal3]|uniref:Eco57I restriction-modification methylase domain-containing protein n=1 Tax=Natrarchaeobius versutus TaxID=1679078 RepID=UPI00350EB47A